MEKDWQFSSRTSRDPRNSSEDTKSPFGLSNKVGKQQSYRQHFMTECAHKYSKIKKHTWLSSQEAGGVAPSEKPESPGSSMELLRNSLDGKNQFCETVETEMKNMNNLIK